MVNNVVVGSVPPLLVGINSWLGNCTVCIIYIFFSSAICFNAAYIFLTHRIIDLNQTFNSWLPTWSVIVYASFHLPCLYLVLLDMQLFPASFIGSVSTFFLIRCICSCMHTFHFALDLFMREHWTVEGCQSPFLFYCEYLSFVPNRESVSPLFPPHPFTWKVLCCLLQHYCLPSNMGTFSKMLFFFIL